MLTKKEAYRKLKATKVTTPDVPVREYKGRLEALAKSEERLERYHKGSEESPWFPIDVEKH